MRCIHHPWLCWQVKRCEMWFTRCCYTEMVTTHLRQGGHSCVVSRDLCLGLNVLIGSEQGVVLLKCLEPRACSFPFACWSPWIMPKCSSYLGCGLQRVFLKASRDADVLWVARTKCLDNVSLLFNKNIKRKSAQNPQFMYLYEDYITKESFGLVRSFTFPVASGEKIGDIYCVLQIKGKGAPPLNDVSHSLLFRLTQPRLALNL